MSEHETFLFIYLLTYYTYYYVDFNCSYYSALSGTSLYDSWVYSGYNFALGLPIIFYGFMDRDIPAGYALKNPVVLITLYTYTALKTTVGYIVYSYKQLTFFYF